MRVAELLPQLQNVNRALDGWMARCPAHDDRTPSLSIGEGADGRILLRCHAGCPTDSIIAALDLKFPDLFPSDLGPAWPGRIVATYDYEDADGRLLFQVVRYEPKSFRQRRPDPERHGEWLHNVRGLQRVLFQLPRVLDAVRRGLPIFVCGGEKDVLAMEERHFHATCNPGGAGKWEPNYTAALSGAEVIIIADKDEPGRKHALLVAQSLYGKARSVKVLELPDCDGRSVKDAHDFFSAGGSTGRVIELVDATPEVRFDPAVVKEQARLPLSQTNDFMTANGHKPILLISSDRPRVQLPGDGRLLSEFATDLGHTLSTANIFSRAGLAFCLNDTHDALVEMTPPKLRTWAEQFLVCYKIKTASESGTTLQIRRTMTEADAAGVLAAPQFISQLKPIERVAAVRMPALRRNGGIELLPEGYDVESQTFTAKSNVPVEQLPLDEARGILDELLAEFAFGDDGRSKSVAISAMLTAYGLGLLPRKALRPCFVFLANAEGAGKSLLVKCVTVPVLGGAPNGCKPKDEDEMRKILLATVMEARPVLLFDNFKGHLSSEALEGFLTSQDWSGRMLGSNRTFTGENNAVVMVTGNGCTVSPDMRRRSLFAELFLEVERAEDRKFRHQLEVPELLERRSQILSALWSLIRAWDQATRPKASRSHASFPQWAETVGGIVEQGGFCCPLQTPKIDAAADVDGADMRTLVESVADGSHVKLVKFDDLVDTARSNGLFERIIPQEDELDHRARAKFGALLKAYDRRLIGSYRFSLVGKGRDRRFQVETILP